MEHFVTLFDGLFMPQGVALHSSMRRHLSDFTLWILCIDDEAFMALSQLDLPNVKLLESEKLETAELAKVKPGRSRAEFCWTITPFAPKFVFEADASVNRVTYLDADLWFGQNPAPIFAEFENSGKSVLITEHAYAPEHEQSVTSGRYCVQFMTFVRDASEPVRNWWAERCIEWCYARFEDGKFGDQKYLDDWPERFSDYVHVLQHRDWAMAPWNATRFDSAAAIFWHFHGLRIVRARSGYRALFGRYPLPPRVCEQFYQPYVADLGAAVELLRGIRVEIRAQKKYSLLDLALGIAGGISGPFWRLNRGRSQPL